MKERKVMDVQVKWDDESIILCQGEDQQIRLNPREAVGCTIVLQEILAEWRKNREN